MDINELKHSLRQAQKELRIVKQQTDELRQQHLRDLLTETELRGDEKQIERRLQILLRSHERKQHFSKLKAILKPKEAGGLSYILVPENFDIDEYSYDPDTVEKWEAVHDHDAVQTYIQKRNLQHFGQAQGTLFTTEPLKDIN
jgi:hypothetical protein